MFNRTKKQVRK